MDFFENICRNLEFYSDLRSRLERRGGQVPLNDTAYVFIIKHSV